MTCHGCVLGGPMISVQSAEMYPDQMTVKLSGIRDYVTGQGLSRMREL